MKTGPKPKPLIERLKDKYFIDDAGCWVWTGAKNRSGGGHVLAEDAPRRTIGAHVASYLAHVGPLPEGFEVDRTCTNIACINPRHLVAVPHSEAVRRWTARSQLRRVERTGPKPRPLAERLIGKHQVDPTTGCWEWQAAKGSSGYGHLLDEGLPHRLIGAHVASYTVHVGPIPEGFEIDHVCLNKLCVNPDHLEAVTHRENMRRSNEYGRHAMRRRSA